MSTELQTKIREYIERNTPTDDKEKHNWERVADQVYKFVETNYIKKSKILYNTDGSIKKISGTKFQDGVFQFSDIKEAIPITIVEDEKPNPHVEQLRKRQNQRKAVII